MIDGILVSLVFLISLVLAGGVLASERKSDDDHDNDNGDGGIPVIER